MALSDIRTEIKNILSNVSGVGVVHEYERWAKTWEKFLEFFKDSNGKINGCMITRSGLDTDEETTSYRSSLHHFTIRYFYGLKDSAATEKTFQDIIEDIRSAFRSNYTLNGTAEHVTPIKAPTIDIRMFGAVLCHYCEMLLTVEEDNPL